MLELVKDTRNLKRGEPAVADSRDYGEEDKAPACAESEQLRALLLLVEQAGKRASTILSPLRRPKALEEDRDA